MGLLQSININYFLLTDSLSFSFLLSAYSFIYTSFCLSLSYYKTLLKSSKKSASRSRNIKILRPLVQILCSEWSIVAVRKETRIMNIQGVPSRRDNDPAMSLVERFCASSNLSSIDLRFVISMMCIGELTECRRRSMNNDQRALEKVCRRGKPYNVSLYHRCPVKIIVLFTSSNVIFLPLHFSYDIILAKK